MSNEIKFARTRRVNRIMNEIESVYHTASLKLGLSDSATFILYTIYDNGGSCLLSDICGDGVISKQTVNSAIRKLEAEGLLHLEQYKGKAKLVVFTVSGQAYAEKTVALLLKAEADAFATWSQGEIEKYIELNQKYRDSLKAQIESL